MSKEYWQYRAADFLCHALPRRFLYGIGTLLADHFYRTDTRGRSAVISNLRQIHAHAGRQPTPDQLNREARETFHNFGKYLVDFFRFTEINGDTIPNLVRIEHPEYIHEAMAGGCGVLVVSSHLGNWELGGALLAKMGYPVNVVVLPMKDKRTNALFQSRRERRGFKIIPIDRTVRGIFDALRRKEFVALLGDRDYSPRSTLHTFFGLPARLPIGPAKLCVTTGAPILAGSLVRQPDDSFVMRIHPLIRSQPGSSVKEVQDRLCRILEEDIGRHPTQWFLFDEFWKNNGNGGTH